jgi:molecular chaperone GrpE (heat shock protein)
MLKGMNITLKFMMSFLKKYGVDKLTAAQMGGLRVKCHY